MEKYNQTGNSNKHLTRSQNIFSASQHSKKFFRNKVSQHYFFLQKQQFLRYKMLTEYFFLLISETENFVQANLPTENIAILVHKEEPGPPKIFGMIKTYIRLTMYVHL